jgi:hypothetical protein
MAREQAVIGSSAPVSSKQGEGDRPDACRWQPENLVHNLVHT